MDMPPASSLSWIPSGLALPKNLFLAVRLRPKGVMLQQELKRIDPAPCEDYVMSRRGNCRNRPPVILPRFSLKGMRQMFEVEILEVGFMIHPCLEAVIYRMKLYNCVIHAIEARLIYSIKAVLITKIRPGRLKHLIGATAYKPVGLDFAAEFLNPCEHRAPIEIR